MKNIQIENGTNIAIYKIILEKAIKEIESKIGPIDKGIKWIIFREQEHFDNNLFDTIKLFPIRERDYKYGFCYIERKEIWISTAAIMATSIEEFVIKHPLIRKNDEGNFLVNVILDELAHIKTKKGHADKEYNLTLQKYHNLYYGNFIF